MADDAKKKDEAAPAAEAPAKKGGLPIKTIIVVLVMLAVEAGALIFVMGMLGKPNDVKAVELDHHDDMEGEKPVEVPILTDSFMNNSSGRVWIWQAEIVAVVKAKHAGPDPKAPPAPAGDGHGEEKKDDHAAAAHGGDAHAKPMTAVREELEQKKAQIRTGIAAIFSAAQHNYFTEPGNETLTRQILEFLRQTFGQDETGDERVIKVLMPKCLGQPLEY